MIRTARRQRGLTQSELGRRAATTQSAIAAYETGAKEPSTATLNRLLAAAGVSLSWSLAPLSPASETVEAIARSLVADEEAECLRLAAELVARLASMAPEEVARVLEHDPGSTGDRRWDALVAGIAERAAHGAGVRTPVWTAASGRFLDRWWFLTPYESLHASALVETPAELANRGVFVHESSLHSV